VLDETGLNGNFDLDIAWMPNDTQFNKLTFAGRMRFLCATIVWPSICIFDPRMKFFFLLFFVSLTSFAQTTPRNSLTGSVGYARQLNPSCCQTDTAVSFGVTYGRRIMRYLEAEAGVTIAKNPAPEIRGANFDIKPDDRFIWIPFGVRGVLPLHGGRVEISAGGGGLIDKYSVSNPNPAVGLVSHAGVGGYLDGGAAIAITPSRRFWLGASTHVYLANIDEATHDRWMTLNAEFSYRF
jgi:hypothetical protein